MSRRRMVFHGAEREGHGHAVLLLAAWLPLAVSAAAYAQKGMGDAEGVVRQGLEPVRTTLSGRVVSVETHPCEKTTGRAPLGTHLILAGADGVEYNVHLGPADAVKGLANSLPVGGQIDIVAFRTAKLPQTQYVAIALRAQDGEVFRLRDTSLRPFWSGRSSLRADDDGFRRGGAGGSVRRGRHWGGRGPGACGSWTAVRDAPTAFRMRGGPANRRRRTGR